MTIHGRVLACLLTLGTSVATAANWTHWRGPEMDGVCREKNLVETWSLMGEPPEESGKNVRWVSYQGGRAAPIVLNGKLYLNARTYQDVVDPRTKVDARQRVFCLNAETGEMEWEDVFNVAQTDIPAPRVGWAPMAGDEETGNVYVHTVDGILRCYTGDGKVVWERQLFEEYGKISGYGGRTQAPIIDEDRVIVGFLAVNWGDQKGPAPVHYFYAFDKNDGTLLWVSAPGGRPQDTTYTVPIIRVIDGVRMLICGNADGGVYAMEARTGEKLWGFRMSRRGLNASPVVEDHRVYITHGEDNIDTNAFGRVQCIDARGRGDLTPTITNDEGEEVPNPNSGSIWRVNDLKAGYASPLVKDGILYVVADTGNLHAFDSKTGDRLWEHSLGTVGKGSPVWADGKLYVMEVNGNVHVLEPSREECKSLSHVELDAVERNPETGEPEGFGVGLDEIYASPAIVDGRVYLVTRDRTICLGAENWEEARDPIPPLDAEAEPQDEVALIQLVPYETKLWAGETAEYELRAYDANGRFLKTMEPELEPGEGLPGVTLEGNSVSTEGITEHLGGTLTAKHGDLTATARLRVYPKLPWKWDFEGYEGVQVPPTWVKAHLKFKPTELDGNTVMQNSAGRGRPSTYVWIGRPDMSGYEMTADVLFKGRRRLSDAGVTIQKYNFILKANSNKLRVQSWAAHLRMGEEIQYRYDPDVWYSLRFRVDVEDGKAVCRGKVWKRDEDEPEEWTLEVEDPHPNTEGSPGLFTYALSDCYFDNVTVTKGK